jgi:hypothetical protein
MPGSIVNDLHPTDPLNCPDFAENFFTEESLPGESMPCLNFENNPVSQNEIMEASKLLLAKNTLDYNGVSMSFIKQFIPELMSPLLHVFQLSLNHGSVPVQLKIAKVIPIHKNGDRTKMDNYRPISLLSNFSKILEKIVASRLITHLESNKLLSEFQFGFRKNHSTLHPLVHFMNFISKSFNKKEHALAIFCDLRKAFDTVDHSLLLKKLSKLGIRGTELRWFESYLADRKQFVTVNGISSDLLCIILGVPQGSILGPLLFLIYINDLPQCSKLCSFLFADDTTLLSSNSNIENLIADVNVEFRKVVYYFRAHRLVLHPEKTTFMLFTTANVDSTKLEIFIDNNNFHELYSDGLKTPIQCINNLQTAKVKFLGVLFDPNLNFRLHIKSISAKISSSLFHLRAARNVLSKEALITLYYSMIHSHLIYAIQIWSCTSPSILSELVVKQKMAIRVIHNASYNAHTESLFKSSSILPLNSLIEYFKIHFMYLFTFKLLPDSFNDTWLTNADRREEEDDDRAILRSEDDYFVPFARLSSIAIQPLVSFPKLWNDFTNPCKSTSSKTLFKKELKKHFLEKLDSNYKCNRLLCIHCHLPSL